MSAIRALADQLARGSDDDLRRLLSVRPDLVLPPVPDFAALSARASTRVSVQRALDNLSRPRLQVLEALVVLHEEQPEPVSHEDLAAAFTSARAEALDELLSDLVQRALVVVTESGALLPVGALADALGPYPAGLGRPFRTLARTVPGFGAALVQAMERAAPGTAAPSSPTSASAARALARRAAAPASGQAPRADAPAEARSLLPRLRGSPVGSAATGDGPATPPAVRWLLDRCLLVPLDALHVELPRGVGRALRDGAVFDSLDLLPPTDAGRSTRRSLRDNAAFGAVAETLRLVTALLTLVTGTPGARCAPAGWACVSCGGSARHGGAPTPRPAGCWNSPPPPDSSPSTPTTPAGRSPAPGPGTPSDATPSGSSSWRGGSRGPAHRRWRDPGCPTARPSTPWPPRSRVPMHPWCVGISSRSPSS
ncbi:hypothetical protein [Arthrobacter sp. RIT-PI-e]|uniref:hypothetical protein n=1 Tax=Arthrobacter sp. RIT-PI-e TaxID=1681197 RepID=UPI00128EBCA7|nr:hypothetical protein [Arthrobacter sp. RIT-PI-e]